MGVTIGFHPSPDDNPPGNPNPTNFKILSWHCRGDWLLIKVLYPDSKNYEGTKLLLFKDLTVEKLKLINFLDPHFSDQNGVISPIARFEPTERGWALAMQIIKSEVL